MMEFVARGARVSDETDLNDDVSCRYYVSRDGVFLVVELSLVDSYAVVMDTEAQRDGPITPAMPASDLARDVLAVLAAHGLHVLDADTVCTPLDMPFQNVEAAVRESFAGWRPGTPDNAPLRRGCGWRGNGNASPRCVRHWLPGG